MSTTLPDPSGPSVFAVIVTFNPDFAELDALLAALVPQVQGAVVVDNGSSQPVGDREIMRRWPHLQFHAIGQNLGIAAAQNIGIAMGMARAFDYILLSDQDSQPAADMVAELVKAAELLAVSKQLACVGPRYLDPRQLNPPPFLQIKGLRLVRQWGDGSGAPVEVDYLIASGCLIPAAVLRDVGDMEEKLFIDYVDIEWGLRAKHRGFQSYGVFAAHMGHNLGEAPVKFMGKNYPVHSPLRHYYMVRNAFWLYRQAHIPANWKVVDGYKLVLRIGFYSIFAPRRLQQVRMMLLGGWHGVRSRMGRF